MQFTTSTLTPAHEGVITAEERAIGAAGPPQPKCQSLPG